MMTDSDKSPAPMRPQGQNSTLILALLLVVVVIGAFGFAILGFIERGQAEAALEAARTESIVREQAALLTADAEAENAQNAGATAVAALNIANDANNAMGTQAANAEAAEATTVAISTLAAESDLAADEAKDEAVTANALAAIADADAATANAGATSARYDVIIANSNVQSIFNDRATAEAGATSAVRALMTATAAYETVLERAMTEAVIAASTLVVDAEATGNVHAVRAANLRSTLTVVSFQVARLSGTATAVAETGAAVAQGATASPRPTTRPAATATTHISTGGLAFVGENTGLVPENGFEGWLYIGSAGETITITAEADFDIIISLFDGEDELVALGENDGRVNYNRIEGIRLPSTDTYVIIVSGFLRLSDGPYTLTIESDRGSSSSLLQQLTPSPTSFVYFPTATETSSVRLADAGLAVLGENSGEVLVGGTEVWLYRGQAGETLTITTEADWDTTLTLFDEDVNALAVNDDITTFVNRQSQIEYMLRETGTYFITVGSFQDQYGGRYKLIIEADHQGF